MELPEGFDIDDPSHLCALLQYKSTRMGLDLIRVAHAVEKAYVAQAIGNYKALINPVNKDIAVARYMNDECLHKRLCAQLIIRECIERTNQAVEHLDDMADNHLIEQSREPYRLLMSSIEKNFDITLARETASLMPVLYWLDAENDIDDLCTEILNVNGITPREAMILAMLNSGDVQPQEVVQHE
jgi:hypothetical protein